MVWLFVADSKEYKVVRVTDPNFFSKNHYKYLILAQHHTRSVLVKDMVKFAKNKNNPQLTNFIKSFVESHPEYQI